MENEKSYDEQLVLGSTKIYIFFGGIAGNLGVPPFEFYKSSSVINENKIFLRDLDQCWYHNGLRGVTSDLGTTISFLQGRLKEIRPSSVRFVGNSMGGFAAILFASALKTGNAIAFAPQTFIGPGIRARHGDARWREQIRNTHLLKHAFRAYDLRPFALTKAQGQKMDIYYSADDALDKIHAANLCGMRDVHIHEINGGGHGVVKVLRDQGRLTKIMAGESMDMTSS